MKMISWAKIRKMQKQLSEKGLIPKCDYCGSFMEIVRVEGSRGLRMNNLNKWEKSGVDIKQLPNSEMFNESYIAYYWECPRCWHREVFIPEQKVNLVSDGVFEDDV